MKTTNTNTVTCFDVPECARQPFILSGYRPVGKGFKFCLSSLFRAHNETVHVWTHAFAALYFFYFAFNDDFWKKTPLDRDSAIPAVTTISLAAVMFATSSVVHLFNCASTKYYSLFYMLDYFLIILTASSLMMTYAFYCRHVTPIIKDNIIIYDAMVGISATISCFVSCWTRTTKCQMNKQLNVIRICVIVIPFLVLSTPPIARALLPLLPEYALLCVPNILKPYVMYHQDMYADDYEYRACMMRMFIFLGIACYFQLSQVPECWYSHYFDVLGQSHQIFHIFTFLVAREVVSMMVIAININDERFVSQYDSPKAFIVTLGTTFLICVLVISILFRRNNRGKKD